MEKEKLTKKREEIANYTSKKNELQERIKKEEDKIDILRQLLNKGGAVSSSFFMGTYDRFYVYELEEQVRECEQIIEEKNKEYLKIKKKLEKLEELDKKREREFLQEIEKKEAKEIEDLSMMLKFIKERWET
jgi:flagellar biosynthesis chaperone FliJ